MAMKPLKTGCPTRRRWRRFAVRLGKIGIVVIGFLLVMKNLGVVSSVASRTDENVAPDHLVTASAGLDSMGSSFLSPSKNLCALGEPRTAFSTTPPSGSPCRPWAPRSAWAAWECAVGASAAAARLTGLLCLCELAWHGFALIQVAPAATFLDSDPICEAILLRHPNQPSGRTDEGSRPRDAFLPGS